MSNPSEFQPIDVTSDEFARFFDELPLWSAPFALKLLERVPLRRGATILDIGCGTGFLSLELAQRCGADARVIAIDPWRAAMAQFARKLDYYGLTNIRLIERDGMRTELPDQCADLIVSNLGINNFDNPAGVLAECFRLSKPGARLLLTTNLVGHMREVYSVLRSLLVELGMQERLAALNAQEAHRRTVDEVKADLSSAGFRVIYDHTSEMQMRFADGSAMLQHRLVRAAFIPAWRACVETQDVPIVFQKLEERLNAIADSRGELSLTVPVALIDASR